MTELTHITNDNDVDVRTEAQAGFNAGVAIAGARPLGDSTRFFTQIVPAGGQLVSIDEEDLLDHHRPRPRRKTGTVRVHTADSFAGYLDKHAIPETEVWADYPEQRLVGVINAHQDAVSSEDATAADHGAGYGDHRIELELVKTDAWTAWERNDRKWLDQKAFAEHIEDQAIDVVAPDSATMLEIAQSFHATTGVNFTGAQRLHSSEVTLKYEENTAAKAGEKGDIEIPTQFQLTLRPFEGGEDYTVYARFRYRLSGGQLALSYHLVRPGDVLREAFNDYVNAVDVAVEAPVFRGRPA